MISARFTSRDDEGRGIEQVVFVLEHRLPLREKLVYLLRDVLFEPPWLGASEIRHALEQATSLLDGHTRRIRMHDIEGDVHEPGIAQKSGAFRPEVPIGMRRVRNPGQHMPFVQTKQATHDIGIVWVRKLCGIINRFDDNATARIEQGICLLDSGLLVVQVLQDVREVDKVK